MIIFRKKSNKRNPMVKSTIKAEIKIRYLMLVFLLLMAKSSFSQQPKIDKNVEAALETVDTNRIKAVITYLADDKLKGRLPGTAGFKMASDYVLKQFEEIGLEPAGENNTYFQPMVLRTIKNDDKNSTATLIDKNGKTDSLIIGKELNIYGNGLYLKNHIKAPLAFVGYGIEIPGKYSDYEGIDVKGKIVVFVANSPKGLNVSKSMEGYFVNTKEKMRKALSKGAVGVLVSTVSDVPLSNMDKGIHVAINPAKTTAVGRFSIENSPMFCGRISHTALQRLFKQSDKNFNDVLSRIDNGNTASFNLASSIEVNYTSTFKDVESWNLIAKITGHDKHLKQEYIVHTAHLDHVGIGAAVNGDSIYNGAHDNAEGVASLLEFARIYKQKNVRPNRSMLLLVNTGEEMGLLGSAYFVNHPTVPKNKIVAAINADMPILIAPLLSIVPTGTEHSSLYQNVAFAADKLDIEIHEDRMPEEIRLTRSDHFSFICEGIPAMYIKYGIKTNVPGFDLLKHMKQWQTLHYHKPSDDINNSFDFNAAKKYAQLNFLISYSISQTNERPKWNKGDYFETIEVK